MCLQHVQRAWLTNVSSPDDDSLSSYNKSIVSQAKLEGQLSALQSQLDTLQVKPSTINPKRSSHNSTPCKYNFQHPEHLGFRGTRLYDN